MPALKAKEIEKLRERAFAQRKPFEEVAVIAKRKYGGEPDRTGGYIGEAVANWNFTRTVVHNNVSRLIQGDPHPSIRAKQPEFTAVAAFLQEHIDARLQVSSITPLLRQAVQDSELYGLGYLEVLPDGMVENHSYFDVYVDNAMGRVWEIHRARYIFIRKIVDQNEFEAEYGKEIKKLGLNVEDGRENEIPGREAVGLHISQQYDYAETKVGVTNQSSSAKITGADKAKMTMAEDGLVEYWRCYLTDDEAASGWSLYIMFADQILAREELPEWMDGPQLLAFASDSISEQFYQPSVYVHTQKIQEPVNYITSRKLRNMAMLEDPPWLETESVAGLNKNLNRLGPGTKVTLPSMAEKPEYMDQPTIPHQDLEFREKLKEDGKDVELPDILQGQVPGGQDLSGKALRELRSEAGTRAQLRMQNRDEQLRDLACYMALTELSLIYRDAEAEAAAWLQEMIQSNAESITASGLDPYAPITPDMVSDELVAMKLPEEVQGVDFGQIKSGMKFSWIITPPLEREDKVDQINVALVQTMPLAQSDPVAQGDPVLALTLAGLQTGHTELADEMVEEIKKYRMGVQQEVANRADEMEAESAQGEEADPELLRAIQEAQGVSNPNSKTEVAQHTASQRGEEI